MFNCVAIHIESLSVVGTVVVIFYLSRFSSVCVRIPLHFEFLRFFVTDISVVGGKMEKPFVAPIVW